MDFAQIGLLLVTITVYSIFNATILAYLWHLLVRASFDVFRICFFKTVESLCLVWILMQLISKMFCWTASIAQCLSCLCPISTVGSIKEASVSAIIFFFITASFVQLTLIAVPPRLSRLLFVITVLAGNVIASLLTLGLLSVTV